MTTTSRVYFVQSEANGLIKIGVAADLDKRVRCLQTMSPVPVRLLGAFPGDRSDEQRLHQAFRPCRAHGEWFEPTNDLVAFVRRAAVPVEELLYVRRLDEECLPSQLRRPERQFGAASWQEGIQVLYTLAEVAALLKVSKTSVRRLIDSGNLRSVPFGGLSPVRVPASAFALYLERREEPATPADGLALTT